MDPAEQSMLDTIMDILPLLEFLAVYIIGPAFSLIVGWYIFKWKNYQKELNDPESRDHYHQEFNDLLTSNRFDYASYLESVLGKVDGFFGPRAFSVKSYELCLTWAFFYPVILGLIFWLFSNQDSSGFGFFPPIEEGRFWKAALIVISIVGMIYSFYKGNKEVGVKRLVWRAAAFAIAFAVTFAVVGDFAFDGDFAGAGAGAIAVIGIFALAVSFSVAGAAAFAFAGAGARAIAVSFAFAGAGTIAFAFSSIGTVAFADAFAFAVAIAIATAIIGVILMMYNRFSKKSNLYLFYPLYFAVLSGFIWLFLGQNLVRVAELSYGFLLFLVVLPIINSVLDWVSLGVTRKLLKKSLRASGYIKKAGYYLIDLIAALLILLALIASLFLAIKAMEPLGIKSMELTVPENAVLGSTQTYKLDDLLDQIKSRSISIWQILFSSDGWVIIMIFSTFLPSLIHGLAFGGFLLTITQPDSSKISRFASYTAPDHKLSLYEKNKIASYLARRSIANVAFPVIGVLLLLGIIFSLLFSFGDIVTGAIGG